MIWVDYVIIGIIVLSALVSLIRGFVREILSLVTWTCAFFISSYYYSYLAVYFTRFENQIIRNIVSIALLFIVTIIIGAVVNYIACSLVKKTNLSGIDRILGICFGVLRGILIVSITLFFLDSFTGFSYNYDLQHSQLVVHLSAVVRYFLTIYKEYTVLLISH